MREAHFLHHLQRKGRAPQALAGGNDGDQTLSQKGRRCRESDTLLQGETFSPDQSCLRQQKERRAKRAGGMRRPPVWLFFPFEVGRFCEQRERVSPCKREAPPPKKARMG